MPNFGQKRLISPLFPEKRSDFDPKMPILDALLTKLNRYQLRLMNKFVRRSFDAPWKMIVERQFKLLLSFYFPDLHDAIDWSVEPKFLNQEVSLAILTDRDERFT